MDENTKNDIKIAFVNPKGLAKGFNLGLAYLCAVIEKNIKFNKLKVFDFNNSHEDFNKKIENIQDFDIVGFSIKSYEIYDAVKIAEKIRDKNKLLIAGGIHPTIDKNFLKENPIFDIAVIGEGEETILDIIEYTQGKKELKNINGISYKENNDIITTAPRPYIKDLDSLPFPTYDFFDSIEKPGDLDPYPLNTSRGCPYSCTYCCANKISGKGFRPRSPEKVVEEILLVKIKYKTTQVNIVDDNFTLDIERAKKILRLMIEKNLGMRLVLGSGIRADKTDKELLELLIKFGCKNLCFGIESGNKKVFDNIKKGETLEDIVKIIKLAKNLGMKVSGFFIIGLPYSTKETEEESIRFAKSLKLDRATWSFLVPFPGTEVWDWAIENNYMIGDWKNLSALTLEKGKEPIISTPEFTKKERIEIFNKANIKTFNYPALFDLKKSVLSNIFLTIINILKYDPINIFSHLLFAIKRIKAIKYYIRHLY